MQNHDFYSTFLNIARENRLNNTGKYKGYKPGEVKLQKGDIIGFPRQKGVDYDTEGKYDSHTDIVTEIKDGYAYVIGGNVDDSVSEKKYKLDDQGRLTGTHHHMVIKFND